jgi:hypothetical protein
MFAITLAQLTNKEIRFDFLKVTKRIRKLNEILKGNLKEKVVFLKLNKTMSPNLDY